MPHVSNTVDLSVVVNAHNEGRLLHRTLKSVSRSLANVTTAGLSSEIIVVLDRPDAATLDFLSDDQLVPVRIERTDFGDLALARNAGVRAAAGRFVAFLDGDDLMGKQWLGSAMRQAQAGGDDRVYYPEIVIHFGAHNMFWRPMGTRDPLFRSTDLLEANGWNSAHVLGARTLFQRFPFRSTAIRSGFGYEDWYWYSEIVARGVDVIIVPETSIFYRRKSTGSLLSATDGANAVVPPSTLFDPEQFAQRFTLESDADNQAAIALDTPRGSAQLRPPLARLTAMYLRALSRRFGSRIDSFYYSVGPVVRPILASSPRVHAAVKSLRDRVSRQETPRAREFPAWLQAEWRDIHTVDPAVYPEQWILDTIVEYRPPRSGIAASYADFCRRHGRGVSHWVLVPWLKPGGADLETLNYVRALSAEGLAEDVLVLATNDADSTWAEKLPDGVRFLEFGSRYRTLYPWQQERLLVRAWLQMRPSVVHIINSELAYRVFLQHAKALRTVSRVFVSTFCGDVTAEGRRDGYPFRYLPQCIDDLQAVFCDNQAFVDELVDTYGFDRQRFHVHYQPVTMTPPRDPRTVSMTDKHQELRILWAGRLDRQKRPDILLDIADRCRSLPVTFHVYGSVILDTNVTSSELAARSNLTYYGPFDNFSRIAPHTYDLLLHTAQWEGLPNTLMEATMAGLPIIAADVGGVGEFIRDGSTGFLVSPYDDVEQYVRRIETLCRDQSLLPALVENARALVRDRHSWNRFITAIQSVPGYSQLEPGLTSATSTPLDVTERVAAESRGT